MLWLWLWLWLWLCYIMSCGVVWWLCFCCCCLRCQNGASQRQVSNLKTHENHPQLGPASYRRRPLPLTNLCLLVSLSAASLWSNRLSSHSSHSSRSSPSWLLRGFPKISLRRDHPSLHLCYQGLPGKVLLTFSPS